MEHLIVVAVVQLPGNSLYLHGPSCDYTVQAVHSLWKTVNTGII